MVLEEEEEEEGGKEGSQGSGLTEKPPRTLGKNADKTDAIGVTDGPGYTALSTGGVGANGQDAC